MIILKLFASFMLFCCFLVGIRKADKKSHNPNYHALAEYMTGFIFVFGAFWAFYKLWW
ncbi:MAG: hypothetical protein HRT55_10365 [Colwellia sp.]|uniref:hypothetical protein n=1 Tax=Colwellia sp. TaxID=56799 RepID=UPI0025C5C082|nr:hypothetical protein [Colwellia sp.]NQZ26708.1 hypothetical protein [Colwellia sp.]